MTRPNGVEDVSDSRRVQQVDRVKATSAAGGRRPRAWISKPRAWSAGIAWAPTNPVAPVSTMRGTPELTRPAPRRSRPGRPGRAH